MSFLNQLCVRLAHHGCSGGLRCDGGLVGLMLGCFDLGLEVRRRVEVLALLTRAAALDEVHAHGDRVVARVNHRAVARMGEAAVGLTACAVAPLKLATHLDANQHTQTKQTGNTTEICKQRRESLKFQSFHV